MNCEGEEYFCPRHILLFGIAGTKHTVERVAFSKPNERKKIKEERNGLPGFL